METCRRQGARGCGGDGSICGALTGPAHILLSPLKAATWKLIKAEPLKVLTFISRSSISQLFRTSAYLLDTCFFFFLNELICREFSTLF